MELNRAYTRYTYIYIYTDIHIKYSLGLQQFKCLFESNAVIFLDFGYDRFFIHAKFIKISEKIKLYFRFISDC